jgi:hypothetical protein
MNSHALLRAVRLFPARLRRGRPGILTARLLAASALAGITVHSGAGPAATAGAVAGVVTWLAVTVRGDLAPPPGR